MKITIDREELLQIISKIQAVVPPRPVIPAIANILLEATPGSVTLTTTDLTVSMQASAQAITEELGAVTLPARRFFQLTRELTTPRIDIEASDEGVIVITSGSSKFRLHGMSKSEFPAFPDMSEGEPILIDGPMLKLMLSNTSFAAAKDDSRQVLNGLLLKVDNGEITFVGTDGKKLAKVFNTFEALSGLSLECIIPLKAVEEMVRILDGDQSIKLTVTHDKIALESGHILLVAKLLSGQFPDYERVMPQQEAMRSVSLHKEELSTLLKQVSLFTSDVSHSVRMIFEEGQLTLQATASDIGDGNVNMPVNYAQDRMEIAFNPHFFLDILRHCKDETVNFGFIDAYNPGSIADSGGSSHYILMPMRLD